MPKRSIKKKKQLVEIPREIIPQINYKNPNSLLKFLTPRYKILGRKKKTEVSAKVQRRLTKEIKRARIMGLLPFTERHKI